MIVAIQCNPFCDACCNVYAHAHDWRQNLVLADFKSSCNVQVVQDMLDDAVSQLMSIQSQRANVPQHVLFPFAPTQRMQQLNAPTSPKMASPVAG